MILDKRLTHQTIDFISLILVVSFIFLHNIYIVLIGLVFSVLSLNKIKMYSFIDSLHRNYKKNNRHILPKRQEINSIKKMEKENQKIITFENKNRLDSNYDKYNDDNKTLTLVESVELLGFIPSKKEDEKNNAA